MTRVVSFALLTLALTTSAMAQAPPFDWARQMGGSGSDIATKVAVDPQGNVYVCGSFYSTARFGHVVLTSAMTGGYGPYSAFLAKYDPSGSFLWASGLGDRNYSRALDVAVDSTGSVIVGGLFYGQLRVGGQTLSSAATYPRFDAFLVKFDSAGNAQWGKAFPGPLSRSVTALTTDSNSSIVVVGSIELSDGRSQAYHAKYDSRGDSLWQHAILSTGVTVGAGIALDGAGNSLFMGHASALAHAEDLQISPGLFIVRYNQAGSLLRVLQPAHPTNYIDSPAQAIAVDADGHVLIAGRTYSQRGVITKLDTNGSQFWSRTCGNQVADLAVSLAGHILVVGSFQDGDSFGFTNLPPSTSWQAFVAAFEASGSPLWARKVCAGNILNTANAVALGRNGHLFLAGEFWGGCRCDSTYIVEAGDRDAYLARTIVTQVIVDPPLIVTQPQSHTVLAGTDVSFTVNVSGTAPFGYQWRLNGTNIPATGSTLLVRNAQERDAGEYTVVVRNLAGAVTSSAAILLVRYGLSVTIHGNGAVNRTPNQADFAPGALVTLNAVAGTGHAFVNWSGDTNTSANPLTVRMNSHKRLAAHFGSTALSVLVSGAGVVQKAPDKSSYSLGEEVTLTAVPARWHSLVRWADGPTNNPRRVTITTNNNYAAIFAPTTAVQTLTFNGISRTAPVGMPAIFVDGAFIVAGSVTRSNSAEVSLLTTFERGSIFFTLDGSTPSFGSALYEGPFVVRRPALIRAIAYDAGFARAWEADAVELQIERTYSIQARTEGGGAVTLLPRVDSYRSNSLVRFSAIPSNGWTFLQWLGDLTGTNAVVSIPVREDLCVEAVFGTTLGVAVTGGGSVTVEPLAALYPYGATARLTGTPNPGYFFGAWGDAATSTRNPLVYHVTNANSMVSSIFGALQPGEAALTLVVNGRGTVTANPRANRYSLNQLVTLTAMAEPNQEFFGWGGDASGTHTNLVVVVTGTKVITATFSARPWLSLGGCLSRWRESGFQFILQGQLGGSYQIERAADGSNWTPLTTVTTTFGEAQISDSSRPDSVMRLYRARFVP